MTFVEFKNQLFVLFEQGAFQEGLDMIGSHSAEFPDERQQLAYYQACLANCAGDSELALNTLSDAVDAGYWFSPETLQNSDELQSLHGLARFDQIVTMSEALMLTALEESIPARIVFEPAEMEADTLPLLFVLHGDQSSAKREAEQWAHLAEVGWLVVLPQSSQMVELDRFDWHDAELAQHELLAHFAEISAEYQIDSSRIVLAGFGAGAARALELTSSAAIAASGFIGIASDIEPEITISAEKQALFFAVGNKDVHLAATQAAVEKLNKAGMRCLIHQFEGGHSYPSAMETVLNEAIAFLNLST